MAHENQKISRLGHWISNLENPGVPSKIYYGLALICLGLFLSDLIYHRHGHFEFEEYVGFYSIFGFCAFTAIIFGAWGLRYLIQRNETYYAPYSTEAETMPGHQTDVKEYGDG